jgi:putative phosphonate metabolism protein
MKRYAIYYAPHDGRWASAAAAWLGWDVARGVAVDQPDPALAEITADPRKYGFHATIKAPFRLREGLSYDDLKTAFCTRAAQLQPVTLTGLHMVHLDGFLALIPMEPSEPLQEMAAQIVRDLDRLRAPLNASELARRRPETLTLRQRELLDSYGYPYVLEQFQFHMTLTGRTDDPSIRNAANAHFDGLIPAPLVINDLCLMGEDDLGRFHLLHRAKLG